MSHKRAVAKVNYDRRQFHLACELACRDETLRLITKHIVGTNAAGTRDRTAYMAQSDRISELGIVVPDGYEPWLRAVIASSC